MLVSDQFQPRTIKAIPHGGVTVEGPYRVSSGKQDLERCVGIEPCGSVRPRHAFRLLTQKQAVNLAITILSAAGYRVALTPDPDVALEAGDHPCVVSSDEFELAKQVIKKRRKQAADDAAWQARYHPNQETTDDV